MHWYKHSRRFVGNVKHNGKIHCAGYHRTLAEAETAVRAMRLELMTHNFLDHAGVDAA